MGYPLGVAPGLFRSIGKVHFLVSNAGEIGFFVEDQVVVGLETGAPREN